MPKRCIYARPPAIILRSRDIAVQARGITERPDRRQRRLSSTRGAQDSRDRESTTGRRGRLTQEFQWAWAISIIAAAFRARKPRRLHPLAIAATIAVPMIKLHRPSYASARAPRLNLIELPKVLAIVGLLAGGFLKAWEAHLVQQRINTTKSNSDSIKTALLYFISRNKRLPCPAIAGLAPGAAGYGQEAAIPGVCTGTTIIGVAPNIAARGIVPWLSLGMTSVAASDAYNNRMTYQVTQSTTNLTATTLAGLRGTLSLHADMPIALGVAPTGNQINGCNLTVGDNSCNGFAVVVILSHGADRLGGFSETGAALAAPTSARELQNAGNCNAFVRADYLTNNGNYFDDILFVLSPDDVLGPLVKDGAISSARAVTQKQLELSRDELVAKSVTAGTVPLTMPAANDGCGNGLMYSGNNAAVCGAAAAVIGFTISSLGPDRSVGMNAATGINDDISLVQSNNQLKSDIIKGGSPCP